MKYLIICSLLVCSLGNSLYAQSETDTLNLDEVHKLTQLSQLYSLPEDYDTLDHFVAYISLPGIDPYAAYNEGNNFLPNTIELFYELISGSKLSIQVFANNTKNPDAKPVKLPRKDFYIK